MEPANRKVDITGRLEATSERSSTYNQRKCGPRKLIDARQADLDRHRCDKLQLGHSLKLWKAFDGIGYQQSHV